MFNLKFKINQAQIMNFPSESLEGFLLFSCWSVLSSQEPGRVELISEEERGRIFKPISIAILGKNT